MSLSVSSSGSISSSSSSSTTTRCRCKVLWSTQSGRAKACSRRLLRILKEEYGNVSVESKFMFDDDPALLSPSDDDDETILWILMVSTTGDGEHCDSIQTTWKSLLVRSLSKKLLRHVKFALFCLGDRAYGKQFCAAGRKLGTRLVQLGAQPFCDVGYGDDGTPNGGVFCDYDIWLQKNLLPTLLPMKKMISLPSLILPEENYYKIVNVEKEEIEKTITTTNINNDNNTNNNIRGSTPSFLNDNDYNTFFSSLAPRTAYHNQKMWKGIVEENTRLTSESWEQNTRHIAFRIDETGKETMLYHAGDICTILPRNSKEQVEKFVKILPFDIQTTVDDVIEIRSSQKEQQQPWPKKCTLRDWLTYCADIAGLPEREDLRLLSYYCKHDKEQHEKLLSLSETSGSALYADYILREKRCWSDVLYDFDAIRLPDASTLLQLLPPLRPRHFSIASSAPSTSTTKVELCVAVVEGKTPLGEKPYEGLCSSYLANCKRGDVVRLWFKPGSFLKLPMKTLSTNNHQYETPILCIGAGTGIAPLRSLILERERKRPPKNGNDDNKINDATLIFGCRKKNTDYYYQNEWENIASLSVFTAFSRDQWHKVYVQQILKQQKDMILNHLLTKKGAIYIAGGAKMARAVKDELLELLTSVSEEKEAMKFLKQLQKQGKYAVEAWS